MRTLGRMLSIRSAVTVFLQQNRSDSFFIIDPLQHYMQKCKKMKYAVKIFITFALFGSFCYPTQAQIWLSDQDIYDEAQEFLDAEEYVEALPLYLLLEKKDLLNANISYKIGLCYLNIRGKKDKSIPYLESAVKSISSDFEESYSEQRAPLKTLLLLGVAYRIDNRSKQAIDIFEMLRDSISQSDPEFLSIVDMHINFCKNAILLDAFPGEPRKEKLPPQINDEFSNYNPVLVSHDSVLYYMEELKFYDALMRASYKNGSWTMPENLTPAIGSDGDHILVGASAEGTTLLLYVYEALKAGEIYSTQFSASGWSEMKPLNSNINTAYNETHASLSPDGKILYFTSNRPGGYGGLDIYKSEIDESGEWGQAVNLGPVVNTPYNEETPIMNSDDEILYFSSQGHLSMGGYDIFYSLKKDDNTWYMPINMGAPICTTDDDLFYFPLEENVSGLMSRLEAPMSTGYDIYQYNSMVFSNSPRFNVRGKVTNADSSDYKEYDVAVVDTRTSDTVANSSINPDGTYDLLLPAGDFNIVVLNKNVTSGSSPINLNDNSPETTLLPGIPSKERTIPEAEMTLATDELTVPQEISGDTLILRTILFSFNNASVSSAYSEFLDQVVVFLIKYPDIVLKIEGYADALGSDNYNQILSEKRAQAVAQYLIKSQIDKSRLKIVGNGEKDPVALNINPDGSDNPEGRKYNRRVIILPVSENQHIIFLQKDDLPGSLKNLKN
jgi:outer membrane protein OmpA-like peptidoglycan-associated protein/tetratricopeptide (TPR) repeat protein